MITALVGLLFLFIGIAFGRAIEIARQEHRAEMAASARRRETTREWNRNKIPKQPYGAPGTRG